MSIVTQQQLPDFDDGPRAARSRTRCQPVRADPARGAAHAGPGHRVHRSDRAVLFRSPREPVPSRRRGRRSATAPTRTPAAPAASTTRNRPCHTNMCVGTSAELMDSSFCTTNCAERNRNNPFQWHKNRTTRDGAVPRLYPGDICAPTNDPGTYDAWRWNSGNCGSCLPANYRCHDGQKRTSAPPSGRSPSARGSPRATATVTC